VEVDGTASGRRSELPLAEGILAFTGSILPQLIASLSFSSLLLSSFSSDPTGLRCCLRIL
jgi:hypothetical protein